MKKLTLIFSFLLFLVGTTYAQRMVKGTVVDSDGIPLIGANVLVPGTTVGTITDFDGAFSLNMPSDVNTLEISYTGYNTQTIDVTGKDMVAITLAEGELLDEIVVTALGISKDEKSLGYSVQKVGSELISKSGAINAIDALSGSVSGLQVTSTSGSAGAATRMVLRGTTNLNGNNQALVVVDGVRIDNSENHSERSLGGVANSNRAIDINPNDIESITVLKGASASALYGLDAANGVLVITTKKGNKGDGVSVEYGLNISFDQANRFPQLQDEYAQGSGGSLLTPSSNYLRSWGPKLDTLFWDGATDNRFDKNGNIVGQSNPNAKTPVTPYDNLGDAFRTGVSKVHNLSFSGGTDKLGYRLGLGFTDQAGIIHNNDFQRKNVSLGTNSSFLDNKLKINTYANYTNSGGQRLQQGSNTSGLMLGLTRTPITFDNSNGLDKPWDSSDPSAYEFADGTQRNFAGGLGFDNPFWVMNNSPFVDDVNRFLGNITASYEFSRWATLSTTIGTDVFTDNRKQSFEIGSRNQTNGRVIEDNINSRNIDAYLQLSGGDRVSDLFGFSYMVGANVFNEKSKQNFIAGDNLALRNFLNIANASSVSSIITLAESKRIGFFGQLEGSYNDWLYLTLTGRQDYLSTLINPTKTFKASDISVFYPSISGSAVLSELFDMKFFDLAKIRMSYAQVGGGAPAPFLTSTTFVTPTLNQGTVNDFNDGWTNGIGFPFLGQSGFTLDAVQGAFDLIPSLTSEFEVGTNLNFMDNRARLDGSWYSRISDNQILVVPVAGSSGFSRAVLNSGALSTQGFDISLSYDLIAKSDVLLTLNCNFGTWRTYVDDLAEGVENQYLDGFTGTSIYNIAPLKDENGKTIKKYEYGQLYGGAWLRTNDVVNGEAVYNPDKPYNPNGQLIINGDPTSSGYGYPLADASNQVIGNPNPDFIMGFGADLKVKNLGFNVLFDWRQGGDMWNGTKGALANYGMAELTENRGSTVIFPGVIGVPTDNGYDITSQENNIGATLDQAWYQGNGGGFGAVAEHFIEDASSLRIRTIGVNYDFGSHAGSIFKNLNLGFSANNILLWTPYTGIDPISSLVGSSSNGQGLDYFTNPNSSSYQVKLFVKF